MSWYTDPQLFIDTFVYVYRITKEIGVNPIVASDLKEVETLNFSKHLSFLDNKESDFDDFKATFRTSGITKFINSQGLVINWDHENKTGTWAREDIDSPFWSLPGISNLSPKSTSTRWRKLALAVENSKLKANTSKDVKKEAVDNRVLDLEAENAIIKAEVIVKSAIINGLEEQVKDLTVKLVQCGGAAGVGSSADGPWFTGQTVPSNWVRFEELNTLVTSENTPLIITKTMGGPKFGNDNTTNVQGKHFYGGLYPIVVVDIAELTPNREEARFDPYVWGSFNNGGISYAARKLFASEIAINTYKTN
ncbi:hypothetical protein MKX03_020902 [Papaver bracteatum]|nr:hypothetical protein MKX03_020902 [Papaver bracteatum]